MTVSYKNIKKKTPIKLEKIGTAILMFTAGMVPIISSLPITNVVIVWINAILSMIGLGAKVFTMMFSEEEVINIEENVQN